MAPIYLLARRYAPVKTSRADASLVESIHRRPTAAHSYLKYVLTSFLKYSYLAIFFSLLSVPFPSMFDNIFIARSIIDCYCPRQNAFERCSQFVCLFFFEVAVGVGASVEGDQSAPAQTAPQAGFGSQTERQISFLGKPITKEAFGDLVLLPPEVLGVLGYFVLRILFNVCSISGFYTPRYSGLEYYYSDEVLLVQNSLCSEYSE